LPPEQRDVFLLYEESGLSLEEIAVITAVGPETAKSRLRYAVTKLRQAFGSAMGLAPRSAVEPAIIKAIPERGP
jgi:RNA polymerase sigma-70 factor (ECF subfamily)